MSTQRRPKARGLPIGLALAVLLGFVVCLLGSSLKNTVQVFFEPMAQSFGQDRGSFALAATVFALTYAVAAPLTGMLADRIGPARVLLIGTVLAGVSLLGGAQMSSFPLFVVTYGILASCAYTMLSYVPIGVLVDRLFSDGRKGFFYALLTNGTAGGFILLVPLWTWLGQHTSWQRVLTGLGIFLLVVIAPLTALLQRQSPARTTAGEKSADVSLRSRWSLVLHSAVLWRLAGAFFACGASMAFIDVHEIAYLADHHISSGVTSASLVLLGACEIVGSLVAGQLCDKGSVKRVLIGGYLLRGASMFVIAIHPTPFLVLIFGIMFGTSYLVTVVATSVWVMRAFPMEIKGVAMGLIWTAHQIGAALSSQFGGIIYDLMHSYVPLMVATGCMALVAAFLVAATPFSPQPSPLKSTDPMEATT